MKMRKVMRVKMGGDEVENEEGDEGEDEEGR